MKVLLLAFVIASLQSDTTALVDASKDAKAKRKSSTTKVITNADMKKSKGKVVVKPGAATAETKPGPTLLEKQATDRTARLAKEAKIAELQQTVAKLESEVAALETSYYEANDLDYRDTVIVKRFNETKQKLDTARKDLAAATEQPQ